MVGFAEFTIGPAHRVRPLAGPMAGSGRTRWAGPMIISAYCAAGWRRHHADRRMSVAPQDAVVDLHSQANICEMELEGASNLRFQTS